MSTVESPGGGPSSRLHLLSLTVQNKAGVLARVVGLFSRRAFNIFSLAVAPTDDDRFSRISIVVDIESVPLEQIREQLNKLVPVVEITELAPEEALEAELLLATLTVPEAERVEFARRCAEYGASLLDLVGEACTVQLAAPPAEVDRFEAELVRRPIRALQRSGRIGLPKLTPAR